MSSLVLSKNGVGLSQPLACAVLAVRSPCLPPILCRVALKKGHNIRKYVVAKGWYVWYSMVVHPIMGIPKNCVYEYIPTI